MAEVIALRFVHIVGGMFWVGAGLFSAFFVIPAMTAAGPAAGAIMGSMRQRHFFVVMPSIALLVILSGARLMWIMSGGFAPEYFQRPAGMTYAVGAVAAIAAFLLGMFVGRPLGMRTGALAQALAQSRDSGERERLTAQMQHLQRRGARVATVTTILVLVAAAGMATARYMG